MKNIIFIAVFLLTSMSLILHAASSEVKAISGEQAQLNITTIPAHPEVADVNQHTDTVNPVNGLISGTVGQNLTFKIDSVSASSGSRVMLAVRVWNFKSMLSAQGTIAFDPTVITYDGVDQPGLPYLDSTSFGTTNVGSGKFTFAWMDYTLSGVSVPDSAVIFVLEFNVTGTSGQQSPVQSSNAPTLLEFIDTGFNTIQADFIEGFVTISAFPLGISETAKACDFYVYPNPGKGIINLAYELNPGDRASLIVYDFTGRVVLIRTLEGGKNTLTLNASSLENGIYSYEVINEDKKIFVSRLLINR